MLFLFMKGKAACNASYFKKVCLKRRAAECSSGLRAQEGRGAISLGREVSREREGRERHRKQGQDGKNVRKETEQT